MINGIIVQNNPLKYIDPQGLQQQFKNNNQEFDYVESLNLDPSGQRDGILSRVGNSIRNAASAVAGVVSNAAVKVTALHFEGRDAINDPFNDYTYADVLGETNKWTKLDNWQVGTHNNNVGKIELKYVHNKTGAELVFDGDSPDKQLTQIGIKGTPNYVNPMPSSQVKGIGSALEFVGRSAGHFFADVVPFWIGGDVRGPDPD